MCNDWVKDVSIKPVKFAELDLSVHRISASRSATSPLTFQRRHFGSFCVRDDAHVSNTIRIEVSLSLIKSWKNMRKNMRKMTRFDLETMTHAVTFLEPFDPPETTEAFGNGDAEPNVNPTISPAGSHPCIQFSVCPDVKLDNFCVPLRCQIFVSAKHCLHPNRTPFFLSKGYVPFFLIIRPKTINDQIRPYTESFSLNHCRWSRQQLVLAQLCSCIMVISTARHPRDHHLVEGGAK